MNMATCPTAERWKAHLDGTLPPEEQSALTAHLDECAACQTTLEQLAAGGDSLLDVARQVGSEHGPQSVTPHAIPDDATQADTAKAASDLGDLDFLGPPTKPEHLGRLGYYEVLEVIGKGGFGVVLKAIDERLRRVVAIKVLAPAYANNGAARNRFIREAQAVAAVKNEHVVGIYDVQGEANPPYLVMECIDGVSLQDKIDKYGSLGMTEILRIGMQIAEGMAAAHKQGKIHRDIKPSNILLENGVERVKITDFGLARAVDDASVTQSGTVAGTPMYMSPEQAEGLPIDHRSDLFSLGTVLYAMCTGHPPFRASGTHAVLKRVIDALPRPIREINNEIPDWLCDIIAKLHAKKPEDRYQSAMEVAELLSQRLADVQAGRAIQGEPSRVSDRVAGLASMSPAHAAATRQHRWLAAVPIVAGVALVLVVAIVLRHRRATNDGINAPKEKTGVLSLRLSDVAIQYRIDGHGANQTGVAVVQLPLEAGEHKVWFTLGDQQFETLPFTINAAKTSELSLEVTADRGLAIFNGQPLNVVRIDNDGGWVQLFNGKHLNGWKGRKDAWRIQEGVLTATKIGEIETERRIATNFRLRFQAKLKRGVAGIRLHTPDDKRAWTLSLHAIDATGNVHGGFDPRGVEALDPIFAKLDEWFQMEIVVIDNDVEVRNNGKLVRKFGGFAPPDGHIGICVESITEPQDIAFREIEIKELPPSTPPVAIAPFGAAKAKEHQDAWAKHLGVDVEITNSIGMKLRLIPPGEFMMGAADEPKTAESVLPSRPQHQVRIARPYYLGAHEITVADFGAFVKATGYKTLAESSGKGSWHWDRESNGFKRKQDLTWRSPGFAQGGNHPVCCVTWHDAQEFCAWLSGQEQATYQLPTEAEWEFACRAGTTTPFSFGPVLPHDQAQFDRDGTCPVGTFPPNAFGLYDMHGNVGEWCLDGAREYRAGADVLTDPVGPTAGERRRIWRGGSWGSMPEFQFLRSWGRRSNLADEPEVGRGFRVAIGGDLKAKTPLKAWVPLFNGTDLAGWTNPKKSFTAWKVEQGVLIGKGDRAFLRAERGPFGDFHLRMEAKYVGGTAGLVLREQSPDVAGAGYECLMENHHDGDFNTGAVAHMLTKNAMGPVAVPKKVTTQEDKWFTLEIIASGNRVQTFVDGKKAVNFVDINNDYKDGFIALNVRGEEGEVHVKKIEVKELPPEERGWVQVFNGVDYDGWTPTPRNKWTVKNGALVGVARGTLTTGRQYGNFHCRIKAKFSADSLGSVVVGNQADVHAEVRIGDKHAAAATGSLLLSTKLKTETIVAWDKNAIPPDTWFDLEIVLRDKQVTVKVNGTTTAEQRLEKLPPGFSLIGLHADQPGTVITVSKIEIKELPPGTQ